jgi:hypothetical protein
LLRKDHNCMGIHPLIQPWKKNWLLHRGEAHSISFPSSPDCVCLYVIAFSFFSSLFFLSLIQMQYHSLIPLWLETAIFNHCVDRHGPT